MIGVYVMRLVWYGTYGGTTMYYNTRVADPTFLPLPLLVNYHTAAAAPSAPPAPPSPTIIMETSL
jgi:hypothetical protein